MTDICLRYHLIDSYKVYMATGSRPVETTDRQW
jgi:hypothetical protein